MRADFVFVVLGAIAVACGGDEDSVSHPSDASGGGTGGAGASPTGGAAGAPSGVGAAGSAGSDAGLGGSAGADSGLDAAPDAPPVIVTLLSQKGPVFTPTASQTMKKLSFGQKGQGYGWVRVELDVTVGDYQPEVPDEGTPDRTEHILFGLFRANQTQSDQRYLMGSAAVTFATKGPHFRMFGRKSIGAGYTTYNSWSAAYTWQKGATYHLDCVLDGIADVQRCQLSLSGVVVKKLEGAVTYLDPASHLSSGFYVELGTGKPGDIEASPLGWAFSDLLVTATLWP
ncbi:MAG: hypothetical protein IT377_06465 [Polyangiaceae bacterium]|nr:hypothetical protein [Polyangiaceae bacterium]